MASYVYGIVEGAADPPAGNGIGGAPLHTVGTAAAVALVSELPDGQQLELGRDELLVHAQVLERALDRGTVLPMRFGVVLDGSDAVQSELLDAYTEEISQQLGELAGKVEIRVRAVYDETRLMREVVAENREVARLRDQLRDLPADATYVQRINLGELVADTIAEKRNRDATAIMQALEPTAVAATIGDGGHERVVLTASFLVQRDSLAKFEDAVESVAAANAERMRVTLSDPLPPHSFVQFGGGG